MSVHSYISTNSLSIIKRNRTFYSGMFLLLGTLFCILFFTACEKEIKLNVKSNPNEIIVEGHIENDLPPYVILTKSISLYDNININNLSNFFVHNARIVVSTDSDSVELVEYNSSILQSLPDSIAIAIAAQFGISIDSAAAFPDVSIYTVPLTNTNYVGVIGKKYDLRIEVNNQVLTSSTTIPAPVFFDSLWLLPHPNAAYADSFFQVYGWLQDPPTMGNYYRYFTKADNEPFLVSTQSVFDDNFFNGKAFQIFIPKGKPIGSNSSEFDFNTDGYWDIADSVCTIKLCQIDKPHYDFWRTLEANRSSQGNPFGSFVLVKSNIVGGKGVWGGYGSITGSYVRVP